MTPEKFFKLTMQEQGERFPSLSPEEREAIIACQKKLHSVLSPKANPPAQSYVGGVLIAVFLVNAIGVGYYIWNNEQTKADHDASSPNFTTQSATVKNTVDTVSQPPDSPQISQYIGTTYSVANTMSDTDDQAATASKSKNEKQKDSFEMYHYTVAPTPTLPSQPPKISDFNEDDRAAYIRQAGDGEHLIYEQWKFILMNRSTGQIKAFLGKPDFTAREDSEWHYYNKVIKPDSGTLGDLVLQFDGSIDNKIWLIQVAE